MLSTVCSAAVNGIEAYPVEVEVNAGYGDCRYQMQTAAALTGPWNNLGAAITMPANGVFNFTDTNALAVERFYRATTAP